mgnify:CR=1 FL=1
MLKLKSLIRRFAVWLEWKTAKWVISHELWLKIEDGDSSMSEMLKNVEKWKKWDPEYLRAKAYFSLLSYRKKQKELKNES